MTDKIKIYLNNKELFVDSGKTILEAAEENGVDIPTLCNDKRLNPFGSCFICIVEVKGARGFMPACATKVRQGMEIQTHSDKIMNSRKMGLELLCSDHYGDCIAPCQDACPGDLDPQGYIAHIARGDYREAIKLIKEKCPLPLSIGRVCPKFCEEECRRNAVDTPVAIDFLKRFAADYDIKSENHYKPEVKPATGKKAALIGAGPASLTAAYFLAQEGHEVHIFEALPKPGGYLRYGIPEYRLPKAILDKEIETITELGVEIHCNKKLGRDFTLDSLKEEGYDAIFIGIGMQKGRSMRISGENFEGVYSGVEFLKQIGLDNPLPVSGRVIVVGGGNTAMDCARSSIRLGADEVVLAYRRAREQMPANEVEIIEAEHEGVKYQLLTNPIELIPDENNRLKAVKFAKMELGEPDASGRRRPVPIEDADFIVEADYIISAIGLVSDLEFLSSGDENSIGKKIDVTRWGTIITDDETFMTSVPGFFSGGDIVFGADTVIRAIGQGRKAAVSMNKYLRGEEVKSGKKEVYLRKNESWKYMNEDEFKKYPKIDRNKMPELDVDYRVKNFDEIELGYDEKTALEEAKRCLECGCQEIYDCKLQKFATDYQIDEKLFGLPTEPKFEIDYKHPLIVHDINKCIKCGKCVRICLEVQNACVFGYVQRGFNSFVSPYVGKSMLENGCESCGLCVDICPMGALYENIEGEKPGPFNLNEEKGVCTVCSVGCTVDYGIKDSELIRVRGNSEGFANDGSTCKIGKFGFLNLKKNRKDEKPLLKQNDRTYKEIDYEEALNITVEKINSSDNSLISVNSRTVNEEILKLKYVAEAKGMKISSYDENKLISKKKLFTDTFQTTSTGRCIKFLKRKADTVLLFDSNIKEEQPVLGFLLNSLMKKRDVKLVYITASEKEYDLFAGAININVPKKEQFDLVNSLLNRLLNDNESLEKDLENLQELNEVFKNSNTHENEIKKLAAVLSNSEKIAVMYSEASNSSAETASIINLGIVLNALQDKECGVYPLRLRSNSVGIQNILGLWDEIDYTEKKDLTLLYGESFNYSDELNSDFTIVFDRLVEEHKGKADLIIPIRAGYEVKGSYFNNFGHFNVNHLSLSKENEALDIILKKLNITAKEFKKEDFKVKHGIKAANMLSYKKLKKDDKFNVLDLRLNDIIEKNALIYFNELNLL